MRGPDSLMIKSHYNHYKHRCEVTRIFMTYVAKKKKKKDDTDIKDNSIVFAPLMCLA